MDAIILTILGFVRFALIRADNSGVNCAAYPVRCSTLQATAVLKF
jgi:hypothetical protein